MPKQRIVGLLNLLFLRGAFCHEGQSAVKRLARMGRPAIDALLRRLTLQWLDFTDAQVRDADLANLQRLTKLQALSLRATQVTDAGLARLQALTNLRRLDLANTQVTDAGAAQLREALPNCRIIGP